MAPGRTGAMKLGLEIESAKVSLLVLGGCSSLLYLARSGPYPSPRCRRGLEAAAAGCGRQGMCCEAVEGMLVGGLGDPGIMGLGRGHGGCFSSAPPLRKYPQL